jgi:methanogenic corrinoid protein MtbC1
MDITLSTLTETIADSLSTIDTAAANAYEQHVPGIIEYVNHAFDQREDCSQLIGGNSIYVLYDNHENHAYFMLYSFRLGSAAAFTQSLLWVYSSYTARGFSPDYFPVALETWQAAVAHYLSPKHATPINQLYQCLIDHHPYVLLLAQKTPERAEPLASSELQPYFLRYLQALLKPDSEEAIRTVQAAIHDVEDIAVCWEQVVQPAMYEIGRLWEVGRISVGQEHLATSITQRVMSIYYPMILHRPRTRGTIIVSGSPNELHELGPRMVADFLEMNGWDVCYAGVNMPEDSLAYLVQRFSARVVCISTTLAVNLLRVRTMIEHVRALETIPPVHIIVGGQAYLHEPNMWQKIGADTCVHSASELVHYLDTFQTVPTATS